MDHGGHAQTGSAGVDTVALLIRLALLLSTAALAGSGLLGAFAGRPGRRAATAVPVLGAVSAALAVASAVVLDVNPVACGVHAALALAVAATWRRRAGRWVAGALLLLVVIETALGADGMAFVVDTVYVVAAVAWFGLAVLGADAKRWEGVTVRPATLSVLCGVLLTVAGLVRLATSGVGFDRRLFETAYGLLSVAVVVLPLAVTVLTVLAAPGGRRATSPVRRQAHRLGAVGVVLGFVAWGAVPAVPRPAELPVPGVPVLADATVDGHDVPVLVSPHRPGENLVHFPASAGTGLAVGVDGEGSTRAVGVAGAEGTWARVRLPRGRSDLVVSRGGERTSVEVDAGARGGPAAAAGEDGPECAAAALGGLVAGVRKELVSCPSELLPSGDADALRRLVGFLAKRGTTELTLVGDESPRGVAASRVVRETASAAHLRVLDEPAKESALVVVSGWSAAQRTVKEAARSQLETPTYGYGVYLAPWLLNQPILTSLASSSSPLRFDPRDQSAVDFAIELGNGFGGQRPSTAGYLSWLRTTGRTVDDGVRVYAAAQVNVMPSDSGDMAGMAPGMDMVGGGQGSWFDGTVVPVSLPLDASGGTGKHSDGAVSDEEGN